MGEQLRLEKERKAQEKKLKDEQEKKMQEKLKKQQEKEAKAEEKRQQKESLKAKKEEPSPENIKSAPTEENQDVTDAEDLTAEAPEEVPESDQPAEGETKPTAVSVIKRGVPKTTKPAPAVVAIKMADLLGEGTADKETDEVMQPEPDSLPTPENKIEQEMQIKEQKEFEKQKLQEAKTLEKESKLKEKQ